MNDEDIRAKATQPASPAGGQITEQVVVFELDKEQYAVPIEDVREVIEIPEITSVPNSPNFISGLINLRGKILPAINLGVRFGLAREHKDIQAKNIIVVEAGESSFGVIVDNIVKVLKVPANSIQDAPSAVRSKIGSQYIKGVIVIAESDTGQRIILLLNLKQLLTEDEKQQVKSSTTESITKPPAQPPPTRSEAPLTNFEQT